MIFRIEFFSDQYLKKNPQAELILKAEKQKYSGYHVTEQGCTTFYF